MFGSRGGDAHWDCTGFVSKLALTIHVCKTLTCKTSCPHVLTGRRAPHVGLAPLSCLVTTFPCAFAWPVCLAGLVWLLELKERHGVASVMEQCPKRKSAPVFECTSNAGSWSCGAQGGSLPGARGERDPDDGAGGALAQPGYRQPPPCVGSARLQGSPGDPLLKDANDDGRR